MSDNKKSKLPESKVNAIKKYHARFDNVNLRVPKGWKSVIKEYADKCGMSITNFIITSIKNEMKAIDKERQSDK